MTNAIKEKLMIIIRFPPSFSIIYGDEPKQPNLEELTESCTNLKHDQFMQRLESDFKNMREQLAECTNIVQSQNEQIELNQKLKKRLMVYVPPHHHMYVHPTYALQFHPLERVIRRPTLIKTTEIPPELVEKLPEIAETPNCRHSSCRDATSKDGNTASDSRNSARGDSDSNYRGSSCNDSAREKRDSAKGSRDAAKVCRKVT
ncbi:hypothetical protein C2S51_027207 [Perilla frutescens var. frutescens]|nr:hypothetical protein C2S51_027207 [Perilla frutescens var. frutescens]